MDQEKLNSITEQRSWHYHAVTALLVLGTIPLSFLIGAILGQNLK